jgi:hypothetical protein
MIKGILSWGKPRIFVKALIDGGVLRELPTPVDDSTNLETSEGDKTEAKIEGGEIEAVRYDKSTYKLSLQIRMKAGSKMPFANKDGLVNDNYEVTVAPENAEAYGFRMNEAKVSVKTSFTTADGILVDVAFDALKNQAGDPQCEFGLVELTESGDKVTAINFTSIEEEEDVVSA